MKLPVVKVDNDGDSQVEVTNGSSNGHTQPQNEETVRTIPNSVHDVALQSAIDAMFSSHEQTYQQFLRSFSHLTVADIARFQAREMSEELASVSDWTLGPVHKNLEKEKADLQTSSEGVVAKSTNFTVYEADDQKVDDDLQEEVLTEGTTASDPLLRSSDISEAGLLKVDNFVTFEDNEDSADDFESSYQASFAGVQHSDNSKIKETLSSGDDKPDVRLTRDTTENTSVMDNLRQYSNELGRERTKLSEDIEDVDEHSHYVSDDVKYNCEKRIEVCEEIPDSDEEKWTYDANFDKLNPGEVEEISLFDKALPIEHKTRLNFAGLSPSPCDNSCSNSMNDSQVMYKTSENDNVVEVFKLDEDFDYDNVILTPKYSVTEMATLTNLLQQGTTRSRVPYSAGGPQANETSTEVKIC